MVLIFLTKEELRELRGMVRDELRAVRESGAHPKDVAVASRVLVDLRAKLRRGYGARN